MNEYTKGGVGEFSMLCLGVCKMIRGIHGRCSLESQLAYMAER